MKSVKSEESRKSQVKTTKCCTFKEIVRISVKKFSEACTAQNAPNAIIAYIIYVYIHK